MTRRAPDPTQTERLERQLAQAIRERDDYRAKWEALRDGDVDALQEQVAELEEKLAAETDGYTELSKTAWTLKTETERAVTAFCRAIDAHHVWIDPLWRMEVDDVRALLTLCNEVEV